MRSVAIMQPYVFPYIGYFQLIREVDLFVFFNDVNFIKKGWINRNKILLNCVEHVFSISCRNVSQNKRICETEIAMDDKQKAKLLSTISHAYKSAPYFSGVFPVIENVITYNHKSIDAAAISSILEVCSYLGVEKKFKTSKDEYGNSSLKGVDRIIDICVLENAERYVNPIGGVGLYQAEPFVKAGIELKFLQSRPMEYKQFKCEFVPWLSVIDVLMFNSKEAVCGYLNNFELIDGKVS